MKIRFHHILLLSVAAFVVASCAKKEDEDYNVLEQTALDAWIKANAPQAQAFGNGMYIEKLRTSIVADAQYPANGDWVRLDFNGQSLQGNIFVTRDSTTARQQNTWTARTYYEPFYTWFGDNNTSLTQGQIAVLKTMRQGDSVRIYMPSRLAYGSYGSSYSNGYQGQFALGANVPAIIDMRLTELVKDPTAREDKLVKEFASEVWGLPTSDTLLYTKFFEKFENKESAITEDSTVKIYYVGKFLDGFIFDTNVDSIAQKAFNDYEEKEVMTYNPKSNKDSYIQAFYDVVTKLHYGDHVEVAFTSKYGYGSAGNSSGKTIIQPYTPLRFEIRILPQETDDDEDKE